MGRNGNSVTYNRTRAQTYQDLREIGALSHHSGQELRRAIRRHFKEWCRLYAAPLGAKYSERWRFHRVVRKPGPWVEDCFGGPVVFYRFADWGDWRTIAECRLHLRCSECRRPVHFPNSWKHTPANQIICRECLPIACEAAERFRGEVEAAHSAWKELMAATKEKELENAHSRPNVEGGNHGRSARRIAA